VSLAVRPLSHGAASEDPVLGGLCTRHGVAEFGEALIEACRRFTASHSKNDPPVKLDPLLKATGARREIRRLAGDGRLEVDANGRFIVVVDDEQHWSRQRFTIAHELAHIVLFSEFVDDPEALRHLRSPELWPVVERACNVAAAELLMPADDVASATVRLGLGPESLGRLQARYAVSWSALLVRLSEVLALPVAVFRWHARHRSEPERWRVHRFYGAGQGLWFPVGMTTRHFSVPVVERGAAEGLAEAELIVDVPTEARIWALASSLVEARASHAQKVLFGRRPPEEGSRCPEVAVFLGTAGSPDPYQPVGGEDGARVEESPNLTLW
jgi:IrrE N-terminal-like domain